MITIENKTSQGQPSKRAESLEGVGSTKRARAALPDRQTLFAFFIMASLLGTNFIAVRFSNQELPPFWGAATRFASAGFLFLLYSLIRRIQFPKGRALAGSLIYGVLSFGIGFALMYWALLEVPAGLASVILASVPLFTLIFAGLVKIERITLRGIIGSLIAIAGIALIYGARTGQDIPAVNLLAVVAAAASFAMGGVIVKWFPPVQSSAMNAIGMLTGTSLLILLSVVLGESRAIPKQPETWMALLYLVGLGSVAAFALMLFTLNRWTASGVSYQVVLSPIVAILLSMWLLDEPLTSGLLLGGPLVLVGVFVGALWSERQTVKQKDRPAKEVLQADP